MDRDLAQALWQAPLPDPAAPARALCKRAARMDYTDLLAELRRLQGHGLPLQPALADALSRYPWSIDLAALAFHAAPGAETLARLGGVVQQQDRRHGVLAWAYWTLGDAAQALKTLANLNPASPSYPADRLARAELRCLAGSQAKGIAPDTATEIAGEITAEITATIAGADGLRLSLLQSWRNGGGVALFRRFDLESSGFPAVPALWNWLFEALVTEGDYRRARHALALATERLGEDHPDVRALRIRMALDAGDAVRARALLDDRARLDDGTGGSPPWQWAPRHHAQHLRCALIESHSDDARASLLDHATRAHRLYPANTVLHGLWLTARERVEDWDRLASDLTSDKSNFLLNASTLSHLGLHGAALDLLSETAQSPPDHRHQTRLLRARTLLRLGRLEAALEALESVSDPAQDPWPQSADRAYWAAEIHLARRDPAAATAVLAPALALGPTRMGLWLNAARAEFMAGRFAQACDALARFDGLKTAQLGHRPAADLRNRITEDAAQAVTQGRAATDSPGLAARHFALSPPAFRSAVSPAPIPRLVSHYWEGRRSPPVERGIAAWARHHPDRRQQVFDRSTARDWLKAQAPTLVDLFDAQSLPATRADLFRVALMARQGGLFTDLDEYPRGPVDAWFTDASAVLVIEEGYGTIANNFLAARPGLALFTRLQARIARELARTADPYPWWHSGPAQLTLEALAALGDPHEASGLRFVSQAEYDRCVATNLPFAHKHTPDHWRN